MNGHGGGSRSTVKVPTKFSTLLRGSNKMYEFLCLFSGPLPVEFDVLNAFALAFVHLHLVVAVTFVVTISVALIRSYLSALFSLGP